MSAAFVKNADRSKTAALNMGWVVHQRNFLDFTVLQVD
jgi:hypothetical protein